MRSVSILLAVVLMTAVAAESPAQHYAEDVPPGFAEEHPFRVGTVELTYNLFVPDDALAGLPLILTLHGSGERRAGECSPNSCGEPNYACSSSDDLPHVRWHSIATEWLKHTAEHLAIVVSPRLNCPRAWAEDDVADAVIALVDSLAGTLGADTDRIYVVGLSLGGSGTFKLLSMRPDRFAAAIPMSGWGFPPAAESYRSVPIWFFHGQLDPAVGWRGSTRVADALIRHGRDALFTHCRNVWLGTGPETCDPVQPPSVDELIASDLNVTLYADQQHVIWTAAMQTPGLIDWLFSKTRTKRAALR